MNEVGVVIGTFGDGWFQRGLAAWESVQAQTVSVPAIRSHGTDLQAARNVGAKDLIESRPGIEFLIFLDADDTLDPHYVEEMLKGTGDLRQPSTLGVYPDGHTDDEPCLIEPNPEDRGGLLYRNHLVVGSMVRADLFFKVGMFADLPVLEDWDLWIRCAQAGAEITQVPKAIYRVGVNEGSRNSEANLHGRIYQQIRRKYRN